MDPVSRSSRNHKRNVFLPILTGGLLAGSFDLCAAFIIWGHSIPLAIASGLLGAAALQGGTPVWLLGVAIHYFIALSAAAVYFVASRKLDFLLTHPFVCGLFYGIAIFLTMYVIVIPLSASPFKGPLTELALVRGLLVHMFCIGLPIAFGVQRFSK